MLTFEYSQKNSSVVYSATYLFRQNLYRSLVIIRAKVIAHNSPISRGSWKASEDSGGGVRDTETYHAWHAHSQTMQHCIHI